VGFLYPDHLFQFTGLLEVGVLLVEVVAHEVVVDVQFGGFVRLVGLFDHLVYTVLELLA